jgi:hypothetical protein
MAERQAVMCRSTWLTAICSQVCFAGGNEAVVSRYTGQLMIDVLMCAVTIVHGMSCVV